MIQQGKFPRTYISKRVSRFVLTMAMLLAATLFGEQILAQNYKLTINYPGNGTGTVLKSPVEPAPGYAPGTVVTLTATNGLGSTLTGWSGGGLSGTNLIQTVTMNSNITVSATFTLNIHSLTVIVTGSGSVALNPPGGSYNYGDEVILTPIPLAGWIFTGWSGDASGANDPETITMNANKTVTATFEQAFTLTVNITGTGTVTQSPLPVGGVYVNGTVVTLTPVADPGWVFTGWSGNLSGSATPETITMNANKTVTATFVQLFALTVNITGNGTVTQSPLPPVGGLYLNNTVVNLTATAGPGYAFTGWSGAASGTSNPTQVTMNAAKSVTATFTQITYTLTLSTTGSGTASQNPVGPTHPSGTNVQITATPLAGWNFTGWTGGLTSLLNPATVIMDNSKLITANFLQNAYQLSVITDGTPGSTVVPSTPVMVAHGNPTVIIANVPVGYQFTEWTVTGGVGAAGVSFVNKNLATTTVTLISGAATVEASFELKKYTLNVITDATPGSAVTPTGAVLVNHGQQQAILASTIPLGYQFKEWIVTSGSGVSILNSTLASTTVTLINGNATVQATFELKQYQLTLLTDGTSGAAVNPAVPVMVVHGQPRLISAVTIPLGYKFKNWTVVSGTVAILNDTLATTTATLITNNVTLRANFELKKYKLTLITDGTAGTALSPATPVMVTHGQAQVISAVTIPAGYQFKSWRLFSGSATIADDMAPTTTATLTNGDAIIQASFELKTYSLTLLTDGTPGVVVSPAAPVSVIHGQPRIISAVTIPAGYKFKSWNLVSGAVALGNDTLATTTAILTTNDVILRATFELKKYTLSLRTDGTPGAAVSPVLPVQVNHGQPRAISATTIPAGYVFKNWSVFSGSAVFGNNILASTTATLTSGSATVQANFQKVIQILDVKIPNVTMKIGAEVTATITVSNDAGTTNFLVAGKIGGYQLVNLQRLNATTYLASFTITAGGGSYPASMDIPVNNLILSDGIIQNLPYNNPIVQNNDAIDSKLPVINSMTVASSLAKVGDIITLNINADSTHYTIHPLTTINGILISAPNVTFVEVGSGNYRLRYTILQGDNDVPAGQLAASVILVKPSGNFNLIPSTVIAPNTLSIDAHAPVIARMEVSQTEVGVGKTVQLVVTADGPGYKGGPGTVINGVPITSDRVTMVEQGGGLYVLNYLVASGDNNVSPGNLNASVVMTDPAGNNSTPYSTIVANTLEIYTELPVAALAAPPRICEGEGAELTVFLSGRAPWGFDLNDGTKVTSYKNITESTYKIPITPVKSTIYKIDSIWDRNAVVNTGSGVVQVIVLEKEDIQIISLASGYKLEDPPVKLLAIPSGGKFSGPGVVPATAYFYPSVAGTENSPHTLYYTLVNTYGCASVDSALVFVLTAEGDVYLPDSVFCNNSEAFTVFATNLAGATGSFKLTDINNNPAIGLSDNGDNSAMVLPTLLQEGDYIVVYEYFNGIPLSLADTFSIISVETPSILNLKSVYCQNEDHLKLESSVTNAIFSGPGVSGSIEKGFVFSPDSVNPGIITIVCTASSSNGCMAISQQVVTVNFAPEVGFELSSACIAEEGGILSFENTTGNKLLVETWEWNFGDPTSGDNNISDLINPIHFYAAPGARKISLTATAFEGCEATYEMDTVIGNMPIADFTWKTDCDAGDNGTVFLNKSISEASPLAGVKWIFKDSDGLNLGSIVSETQLDSAIYVFDSQGDYFVELLVESALGCTDTTEKEISIKETFTPPATGYSEGFNTSHGLWTVESENQVASWVWNAPDFEGFSPNPADKAWYTNLPVDVVGYLENSWIQSPCFDLSGMKHPLIQLDIMKSFSSGNGAVLQYMDDQEEGWKTIGEVTPGIEWYNVDDIQNKPGGSSAGWGWDVFNPDSDWVTAAHDIDELAGKPYVSFRIAFASDETKAAGNQGFAFDNIFIAERSKRAVLEHFTNSSDASSRAADDVVDAFGSDYSSDVIDIQYHMDYPGTDPMNQNSPDPSSTRAFNYGIPKVPYAVLDGGVSEEFRYDFSDLKTTPNEDNMKQLTLQVPVFEVDLEVVWLDQILEATTSVTCNVDYYAENIQLYVVVFEASVNAYTGINGDTAFRNVVLDMLPTPAGKLLGDKWSMGNNDTRVNTWIYQPFVEDIEDLAVVAFVQDRNSKQILQAAVKYKTPQVGIGKKLVQMEALHIYPNPARSIVNVNLGRASERDGRFEVIDMNGRIVLSEQVPSGYQVYQLDVQKLNRGFYLIQWIEGGDLRGRSKVILTN